MRTPVYLATFILLTSCAENESSPSTFGESMLDRGEHKLAIFSNESEPASDYVIVFESGLGDDHTVWQQEGVATTAAKHQNVILYDRSGYGDSTVDESEPRDIEHLTNDLQAVVAEYSDGRSVVLVGHSLGGMVIRDFAIRYPEQTAALLFVDASHELYNHPTQDEEDLIYDAFAEAFTPNHGAALEARELRENTEYMSMLGALPDVPVIVITSMKTDAEHNEEDRRLWFDSKEALKKGVSDFEHVKTSHSGHYIMLEQPELVAAKLKELLAKLP